VRIEEDRTDDPFQIKSPLCGTPDAGKAA
jgi:hypothetical protein